MVPSAGDQRTAMLQDPPDTDASVAATETVTATVTEETGLVLQPPPLPPSSSISPQFTLQWSVHLNEPHSCQAAKFPFFTFHRPEFVTTSTTSEHFIPWPRPVGVVTHVKPHLLHHLHCVLYLYVIHS